LAAYIDDLQGCGRYTFQQVEALNALGVSPLALRRAAGRLVAKGRVVAPRRGFFVIVPLEYRSAGGPPASWFIDDLMRFHEQPYYVGLLSAAALQGAAHQQPQEFQVVTSRPLRPTSLGRSRIRFFTKRYIATTPTVEVKTETGQMRVSSPEATALDLVRYSTKVGHLNQVATVLTELVEQLDKRRLLKAAQSDFELSCAQRLGFLLDLIGAGEQTDALAQWIANQHPQYVSLRADRGTTIAEPERNERWRLLVNEVVEPDA
jgi:predicted transcriptional regulator of viral defense system